MFPNPDQPVHAYLIRCWHGPKKEPVNKPVWRFSLENVLGDHSVKGFSSFDALAAYLKTQLQETERPPEDEDAACAQDAPSY